ncbi:dipeptidyl aminopeptidase/acylaminoacyl peptidase [Chryseobacterium defluvii]|uniref:Dipeptidyl aminopeptidase/acylaminoacyl peptidase n=1 Tax=Chryseobacterium defluvii TaxID=160396 RepID=A0A840KMU4_9FLAO|nr:prolyl oligopeptidase family serine peptidase [Chryseobacterium defluvii]MBB4808162.1 dipeptidyl aminopeptidase/acylaminoacyl peptidase [Chryseobacterium defluvii]
MFKFLSVIVFLVSGLLFYQNGKILSKEPVDLTTTSVWKGISDNNQLKPKYQYLSDLNFYSITYLSDGQTIKGMTVEPKKQGKYPVIIFNRGGNRNFAPLNIPTLIMYTSKLADNGYIIIGSNYREKDEFGGAEVNDVLYLTETVKEMENADPNRIGMFGWSRGGMMTYLALQNTDKIKTAVIGNGASDLFSTITERPEMEKVFEECIPGYSEKKTSELQKRSAIYWPEKLNKQSSLLILCGTKDQHVSYLQSEKMADRLRQIGYNFELKKFETDHFFSDKKEELDQTVIEWFDQKLKQ